MSKVITYPLEFAEVDGVVKDAFWTLISRLAEFQRTHVHLYGQIEHELGWVNVNLFKLTRNWPSAEARWLHRTVTLLQSSKPGKTYVIRFNGGLPGEVTYYNGIPEDVYFLQVYAGGPCSMNSLRDEHLRAQSFYSLQLAKPPAARREEICLILQDHIAASTSCPFCTAIYNFLYNGSTRRRANHHNSSGIPSTQFLLLSFALLAIKRGSQAEGNVSLQQEINL